MTDNNQYHGGCACGAIRYQACGVPVMVAYCHCDDCRKSCGSVVATFAGFQKSGFELHDGTPNRFSANAHVTRSFCTNCGTPLFYENQNFPENIYIHIGSFEKPELLPPDRHTWVSSRISWHVINDELTQYKQLSNDGLPGNTPSYEKQINT